MSRRDKILSLAISNKQTTESVPLPVNPSIMTRNSPKRTVEPAAIKKTDLNELWSRPLNYKNFPTIFEHQNEYCNSSEIVQDLDLTKFNYTMHENKTPPSTRHSLTCYENLSSSDEDKCDKTNLFNDSDDSVKDKDYSPNYSDSDSNSSLDCNETRTITILVNADVHGNSHKKDETSDGVGGRVETVQSRVQNLNEVTGLLDTEHDILETDNLIETENGNIESESTEILIVDIECERRADIETPSTLPVHEKGLTKSGLPRKRRLFDIPLSERKRKKRESDDEKLSLKPPCGEKCRKKCTTKFTEEMRKEINEKYKSLSWESKGLFIKGYVDAQKIKTRKIVEEDEVKRKRDVSYKYYLYGEHREKNEVCRPFFLSTLGYNAQNSRHILTVLGKEIDEQKDKRGGYQRKDVINKDQIKDHIESFNPVISHYRREHAPNRLYLPSDLNITMMHECFTQKYPDTKVSLETYRKTLKSMNISFAHLGNEECEKCALFKSHQECSQEGCEICTKITDYDVHKLRYTDSREEYQKDKELASTDVQSIYFSVDLQKVIMLPRMDQYKSAIFCPRIIAFNESFVPLGSSSGSNVPYAVLWDETISGRRQEDIISAYRSFLIHKRDVKHIVLWADNCSAQNKNWAFMCFLVNILNSQLVATETVTIKYFEPGHTFMSADHFHHQVEASLKKKKKVYDFDDFVDAVIMSNSKKNIVKQMTVPDFYNYEDHSSQHKIKNMATRVYLKDIMAVKAQKGEFIIKYKDSHVGDWKELDFLQVKIIKKKSFPNTIARSSPRGITSERKQKIIATLVPLMPETRRHFWINVPEITQASKID